MTVYVDPLQNYDINLPHWKKGQWCHMMSSDLDELHSMAKKIGLKRSWFQDKPRFPHYDLRPSKRTLAVLNGATEVSSQEMIKRILKGE